MPLYESCETMNRVVVVEDERLLVEMLTELFAEEGFAVDAFATADEAWQHLQAQQLPQIYYSLTSKCRGRWTVWRLLKPSLQSGHQCQSSYPLATLR